MTISFSFRPFVCVALLSAAAVLSSAIAAVGQGAETYPSRTIRIIVPFAPGGVADITARIIAQKLQDTWGNRSSWTIVRALVAWSAQTP